MSKLGGYRSNNENAECPINVFLDTSKTELVRWNKEKEENDVHTLSNFLVLNVGFTVRGKIWDDTMRRFTDTYFSNEIKDWSETLYAIKMQFINKQAHKTLVAKGPWKTGIKPFMPAGVGINAAITVLDLNDNQLKEFFVGFGAYLGDNGIQKQIEAQTPDTKLSLETVAFYALQGSDVLITEKQLDALKGSEAAKYKTRYVHTITAVAKASEEEVILAEEKITELNKYFKSRNEYYGKTYGGLKSGDEVNEYTEYSNQSEAKEYAPMPTGGNSLEETATDKAQPQEPRPTGATQSKASHDIELSELPF